jgi:hypothetical protein
MNVVQTERQRLTILLGVIGFPARSTDWLDTSSLSMLLAPSRQKSIHGEINLITNFGLATQKQSDIALIYLSGVLHRSPFTVHRSPFAGSPFVVPLFAAKRFFTVGGFPISPIGPIGPIHANPKRHPPALTPAIEIPTQRQTANCEP